MSGCQLFPEILLCGVGRTKIVLKVTYMCRKQKPKDLPFFSSRRKGIMLIKAEKHLFSHLVHAEDKR